MMRPKVRAEYWPCPCGCGHIKRVWVIVGAYEPDGHPRYYGDEYSVETIRRHCDVAE